MTRRLRRLRLHWLALASMFSLVTPLYAQSFVATGDTYTKDKDATANFGSDATVRVQTWSNITGFARFDLSSFPIGDTASAAEIELSVPTVLKSGTISIHKVLGDWSESALTAASRPALGPAMASFSVSSADAGRTLEVDVTALFNQLVADRSNDYGIALVPANVNAWFASRESGVPMRIVATADSGGTPPPGGQTLATTADAYTKSSDPSRNFGQDPLVRVQKWSDITAFVNFDLSSFSAGQTVDAATLRLSVDTVVKAGPVSVHRVLGPWQENGITHANRPVQSGPITTFDVSSGDAGNTIAVDVTDVVNQILSNPAGSHGIALSTATANVWMHSKESGSPILLDVGGEQPPPPPPPPPPPSGELPNIVFFLADDMGWGDVGTYNAASAIPTPNIDRLADEGVWFFDAHSTAAKCAPSRYSAITGNYEWRGRNRWGQWNYKGGSQIRAGQRTIGDLLNAIGYRTAAIGKWHLGGSFYRKNSNSYAGASVPDSDVDFARSFDDGPLQRGFDFSFTALRGIQTWPYAYFRNDSLVGSASQMAVLKEGTYGRSVIPRDGIGMPYWDSSEVGPDLVDEAIGFISSHHSANVTNGTDVPFFLYYASQSAHGPYTPPASLRGIPIAGASGINRHTDMIYEIDVALGLILQALEERGLTRNTIVVFASDNGGLPNEVHRGHDAVGGLRGQKGRIYEGGHRVPLIFKWGDGTTAGSVIVPGQRSDQLASLSDIAATLAALVGTSVPADQALDSYDLSPILKGAQPAQSPIRSSLVMQADQAENGDTVPLHFAVRQGGWKLVFDENDRPVELYNLAVDLAETNDRINDSQQAARVTSMTALLGQILGSDRSAP